MLLLHCSLAHSGAWDGTARALGARWRITAPDIVGHGNAPDHDPAQDFCDQAYAQVFKVLPEGPFDLVGHSFGAVLALRIALSRPDLVRSLTLIEPVLFAILAGGDADAPGIREDPAFAEAMARGDTLTATGCFLKLWGVGTPFERLPPAQQAYMQDRIGLIQAGNPTLFQDRAGIVPQLPDLKAPLLLIEGGDCVPIMHSVMDAFERAVPGARRLAVPGAGHMVPITHPGPVAAAIRQHALAARGRVSP